MSIIGVGKHNIDLDFTILQKKELNVFGSRNALTADFIQCIDAATSQPLGLEGIISKIYPYHQAALAFEEYGKNLGSTLKVLLAF